MKLQFDPTLDYQQDAINAVVNVFGGQPMAQSNFTVSASSETGLAFSELGIRNELLLNNDELCANVQKVQEANHIEKISDLHRPDFSIEMETGTGKTYVYLRTIFELSKNYGFKKFIIVVPSVAIREGVLKSIDITKGHFSALYENASFDHFVYDSKKLGNVSRFASSDQIQIMVMNIQSFQKDWGDKAPSEMTEDELRKLNVIHRENDRMSGRKPIEYIQATRPVVIIDEPQSVDNTEKAKKAIAGLNACATLRYSATHRETHNLLYKLDPVRAYDLRLVKQIEVDSVTDETSHNAAYVKLCKTDNKNGIKAQIEFDKAVNAEIKRTKLTMKQGDDLYQKSGGREIYRNGYILQNISCVPGDEHIGFTGGHTLQLGAQIGGMNDEIMRAQVITTVQRHLEKEAEIDNSGIKVLSLFFIDKVANYRVYNDDGTTALGKIGKWFEDAYKELTEQGKYRKFVAPDIAAIHDGYFSRDKKGRDKNTTGATIDDNDTYNLIMRDKEKLLDLGNSLRFIFSHSALREGWDNPNVFQICTLNETRSNEKKRQEIGRGLRLPVNQNGERVHDDKINRLVVVANESYDSFVSTLQTEYENDCGIKFGRVAPIAFTNITRIDSDGREEAISQEESAEIWAAVKAGGYIGFDGKVLEKFDPRTPGFTLDIDAQYDDINAAIIDIVKKHVFSERVHKARDLREVQFKKEVFLSEDFAALWEKIKHRTRYRVQFDTNELIDKAVARIKALATIEPSRIIIERREVAIQNAGVGHGNILETNFQMPEVNVALPDLLAHLQKETELTRRTLVAILIQSERLNDFCANPQQFMSLAAREISRALHRLMINGIQYEQIAGYYWEMKRIEEDAEQDIKRYLDNLQEVKSDKCPYDYVECDSEVEKKFARDLDSNVNVRLFTKLPRWFQIATPIGPYNPDWALVTLENKLYFVCETKSTHDEDDRRTKENNKVKCGERHFKEIFKDATDAEFKVVTKLSDLEL